MIRSMAVAVMAVAFVVGGVASANMQYELRQEIGYIDCTNTNTQNGHDEANDVRCLGAVMPTVSSTKLESREVVLTGTYESIIARELRVYFDGIWYVLGVDDELSVVENDWKLDLRGRGRHNPGIYSVVVEVITTNGLLLRDESSHEVVIYDKESNSKPIDESSGNSERPLADTGEANPALIVAMAMSVPTIALIWVRKKGDE